MLKHFAQVWAIRFLLPPQYDGYKLIHVATITLVACHSYTDVLHVSVLLPNSTHAPEDSETK